MKNSYVSFRDNTLYYDGTNAVNLLKKYGLPLYILSANDMVEKFSLLSKYILRGRRDARLSYITNGVNTKALLALCAGDQTDILITSSEDLALAVKSDFPPSKIRMGSFNYSEADIDKAIDYGIDNIIISNMDDLLMVEKVAGRNVTMLGVLFNIPENLQNLGAQSLDQFYETFRKTVNSNYVHVKGFFIPVPKQVQDADSYINFVSEMLVFVKECKNKYNYNTKELYFSRFGASLLSLKNPEVIDSFVTPMLDKVHQIFEEMSVKMPVVVFEPTKEFISESGIIIYAAGLVTEMDGVKNFVSADNDGPLKVKAPWMRQVFSKALSDPEVMAIAADPEKSSTMLYKCFKLCKTGDLNGFDKDYCEKVPAGDIVIIFSAFTDALGSLVGELGAKSTLVLVQDGIVRAY